MRQVFLVAFAIATALGLLYLVSEEAILSRAFGTPSCVCECIFPNTTTTGRTSCPSKEDSSTQTSSPPPSCPPPPTCPPCASIPPPSTPTTPSTTQTQTQSTSTPSLPGPHRKFQIYDEEMHANFERVWEEYKKFHTAALEAESKGLRQRYVYLSPNPAGGFGNRFPSFVTGLIIALLTKRVTLIRWDSEFNGFADLLNPGIELVKPGWLNFNGRTSQYLTAFGEDSAIFLKENFTTYFQDKEIIEISSNDNPLVLMYGNPHYTNWMLENFGTNPYSIVAPRLLPFSPKVMAIVNDFKAKHFGEFNIGIQMRTEINRANFTTFGNVARLLQQTYFPKAANRTHFFMASDNRNTFDVVKQILGNDLKYVENFHQRHSQDAEIYAMVDVALLSECDILVISHQSTFGGIAAGLHATMAYMVNDDNTYGALAMVEPCYWGMRKAFKRAMSATDPNHQNPIFLQQLLIQTLNSESEIL